MKISNSTETLPGVPNNIVVFRILSTIAVSHIVSVIEGRNIQIAMP